MANDNNFVMLVLISIIVFLLFIMNRSNPFEGYDNSVPSSTVVSNVTNQILNTSATNAVANSNPVSTPVSVPAPPSIPTVAPSISSISDIFKSTDQSNIPTGLQSNTYSASFNNDLGDNTNPSNDLVNLINNNTNTLTSNDLLPSSNAPNDFNTFKINASYIDSNLAADAVHLVGVDTIGSTKRNASTDLRGNVPCPKFAVSPWNNSTIDPDTNNKGFC